MRKNFFLIITIVVVALLIFILILMRRNSFVVVKLDKGEILTSIEKKGAAILYTKDLDKDIKQQLRSYYDEYKIPAYYSDMNLSEINGLLAAYDLSIDNETTFIIFMNREPVDVVIPIDKVRVKELLDKYLYNIIPKDEIAYQVLSTANEYIKKVNSKEYTVAVFGINDCSHCDVYLPTINDIARDYNLNIYYFNRDEYDPDEYEKIMELDFEIPAKCTTTGYSTSMNKTFPKPMTIITKSGEFVDCIRGNVTRADVLKMLKEYKIVKE